MESYHFEACMFIKKRDWRGVPYIVDVGALRSHELVHENPSARCEIASLWVIDQGGLRESEAIKATVIILIAHHNWMASYQCWRYHTLWLQGIETSSWNWDGCSPPCWLSHAWRYDDVYWGRNLVNHCFTQLWTLC